MTTLLTTMRERLAEAESDAERLRAAIEILEQTDTPPNVKRTRAAATSARATSASATAAVEVSAATAAPAAPAAPRPRKAAPRKGAKSVVPLEKLLKVVGDTPGMTTTSIAKATGGDQSVLLELLKESEQKGEVRRQGERRATSWFRVTDEDRIAARAVELAAQSKSAGGGKAPGRPTRRKVAAAG